MAGDSATLEYGNHIKTKDALDITRVYDHGNKPDVVKRFDAKSAATAETPKLTETQIGQKWDDIAAKKNPSDRAEAYSGPNGLDKDIVRQVKDAVNAGGNKEDAIRDLQQRINDHVKTAGGPLLTYDADKNTVKISHMRMANDNERGMIDELKNLGVSDEELLQKNILHARVGSEGNYQGDTYLVADATPKTYKLTDKVNEVGGADKKSAELSKDFPSMAAVAKAWQAMGPGANEYLGKAGVWDAKNPEQKLFADELPKALATVDSLPPIFKVDGCASRANPEPVNAFLKQKGFDIQLQNSGDPRSTYVAGTLSVEDKWDSKGKSRQLEANDGKTYDGIWKEGIVHTVNNQQIAEIQHKNGARIFAIPAPEKMDGYQAEQKAKDVVGKILAQEQAGLHGESGGIQFPMVDMNSQTSLSGLVGMKTKDGNYSIDQALMQTKIQMDENGFKAKSAFAAEFQTRGLEEEPETLMQIKDKFIFVAASEDGNVVLSPQIGQEYWKRPPRTN